MAAAISSSISRTKRKNTLMAIKQSTKFISKAFGAIDANSSLDERKIFSKDEKLHTIATGPYKGGQVKPGDGIPFGAVMYILRANRTDKQYRDLIKFFVFLFMFVIIQFELRRVFDSHFQASGVKDQLIEEWLVEPDMPNFPFADERKFETTGNWEEFFMWMEGPFLGVMFRNTWYNDQPRGNYSKSGAPKRYLGIQSHIMGKIMMRQCRGVPIKKILLEGGEEYEVHPDFVHPDYQPFKATNGTVHPVYGTYMNSLSNLEGVSTGPMTWTMFGRESWLHLFPHDEHNATLLIEHLKNNLYVDQDTRIISIDFVLLNPSSNVITTVRLIWESTTQGVMRHKVHIMAMPINMYHTTRHYMRGGVEFFFIIGLIWLTITEIREMIQHKPALYFSSAWNRLELINIVFFWMGFGLHFWFVYEWNFATNWTTSEYLDIFDLGYNFQLNARIAAGNTLLSFLKVFKYLQVSDRFNLLWITLGKATHDLMSFLIIFSLFMLGFGVVGMLIFGPDIENYSTMTATLFTLFQMLLGDFDYDAMSVSAPLVAPIYFATYIIAVFFILMNMMISIIIMGFEQAKSEQASKQNLYVKVPFVYDSTTTKLKTWFIRCQKGCGWVGKLKPHQFRNNNHAVHLLSDPKKQVRIADSELLTLNGYKQEGKDVIDPTYMEQMSNKNIETVLLMEEEKNASSKRDKKNKKKNSRSMEDIMAAAKRAAQKATLLRKEVSRSRYEFWCDNVKLAKYLKQIFQAPGIIRAYKRLLAGESNLDTDVYEKLLSVNDLSTVMGASAAMQAVYLYKKIDGDSAHDTDDSVKAHSDSWVIKKTSEDVDVMQDQLDSILAMVTILAQRQDDLMSGGGGGMTKIKNNKKEKNNNLRIPKPPEIVTNSSSSSTTPTAATSSSQAKTKVVPFSPLSSSYELDVSKTELQIGSGSSKVAPEDVGGGSATSKLKKKKSIRF